MDQNSVRLPHIAANALKYVQVVEERHQRRLKDEANTGASISKLLNMKYIKEYKTKGGCSKKKKRAQGGNKRRH
jgi:hypothetical protein